MFFLTAAILIAAAGIVVDLVTLQASNARLLDAHRFHLEDLAKSVDQNTDNIFQQMRGETSYAIRHYPDDLASSPIGMEPLISDVIVLEGARLQNISSKRYAVFVCWKPSISTLRSVR